MAQRETGTVKWFHETKGYGFIIRDNGEKEAFVHFHEIQVEGYRTLVEGQRCEFTVVDSPKGPNATNVQLLN